MCGRFALGIPKKRLEEVFNLPVPDDYAPRYNVAPGLDVLVVASDGFVRRRWGLVPHWADDPKVGHKMINARSETVFEKPSFRDPVRTARCLVPAQAFYEWKREGGGRQPFATALKDSDVFAMAGIMAHWQSRKTGEIVDSMAVLTCAPNAALASIHDRMPVILPSDLWSDWLNPVNTDAAQLASLLVPYPAEKMRVWPVSPAVNRVASEGAELLSSSSLAGWGKLL